MKYFLLCCYMFLSGYVLVSARIDWDVSCAPYRLLLERHLYVARQMAKGTPPSLLISSFLILGISGIGCSAGSATAAAS